MSYFQVCCKVDTKYGIAGFNQYEEEVEALRMSWKIGNWEIGFSN